MPRVQLPVTVRISLLPPSTSIDNNEKNIKKYNPLLIFKIFIVHRPIFPFICMKLFSEPTNMQRSISIQNSLPYDLALKITSSLQVLDVCSLGSCSRFWRELCGSDCVWEALCKDRWPQFFAEESSQKFTSSSKGWRGLYISKHKDMAGKVGSVANLVERAFSCNSIEVGNYLEAVEIMNLHQFGFKDVEMFFLKPTLDVFLNLIGLHYCVTWLGIPGENVSEALDRSNISERQVCVQWWKLGRWFYGFRLRDEFHSRHVSLQDLAASNEEILSVLHRGVMHEVFRVQISAPKPTLTSWSQQIAQV